LYSLLLIIRYINKGGILVGKNNTKSASKEILGKSKRIYKVDGSKKEHVKHKGNIITVSDYKKLMK
jgi:hypothetical protein